MAEEQKKSTRRPRKPAAPKGENIRVIQHYFDKELQRIVSVNEKLTVSKERAELLVGRGLVVRE